MPDIRRLSPEATSPEEVLQYFQTRARQYLIDGYRWSGDVRWVPGFEDIAYESEFFDELEGKLHRAYYILPAHRHKGVLRQLVARGGRHIAAIGSPLAQALSHLVTEARVDVHYVGGLILTTAEYQLVQSYYNEQRTKRSGVLLMNHIDEGLAVMDMVGADRLAMRAFCLHPMLQADADLRANLHYVSQALSNVPDGATTIALAMEYRSVANEYLAHCMMRPDGIRLSPLKDVNDMLIGDKVQNRKDFEQYHAQTHPNRNRLAEYFQQWCSALGVSEKYEELKALLPA